MDSLTQALLGAGVQGAVLGRHQGRRALAYGALLGTLPDLDVVIRYADPVSAMTYHRGFSHSLFVLTGLAALLTWAIRRYRPNPDYGARQLFLAIWLALITHPLLDAFTSYGTQLFWPFEPVPTAWSSIFIIDPLFTLPLLAAVLAGICRNMTVCISKALSVALAWCVVYLGLSLAAQHLAETRVRTALVRQGITPQAVFSTPMPFNTLLWRVIVKTAEPADHYVEAVSGVFDRHAPETVSLPLGTHLATALAQSSEYTRLAWFTGGWLRHDVIGDTLVVTDLRMGVAGYYTFRFAMAKRDGDGDDWQAIVPARWPSARGDWAQWQHLFKRIVTSDPPLPLAAWTASTGDQ